MHKAFSALLVVLGEVWCRLYTPYQRFPWKLCQLADTRVPSQDRHILANQFLKADMAEMDVGYSQRLRAMVQRPEDILEGGRYFKVIDGLTMTKCQNVQVEDNFARAVAMRRAAAGKSYLQSSGASKHVLAELKAAHRMVLGMKQLRAKPSNSCSSQCVRQVAGHDFKQLGLDLDVSSLSQLLELDTAVPANKRDQLALLEEQPPPALLDLDDVQQNLPIHFGGSSELVDSIERLDSQVSSISMDSISDLMSTTTLSDSFQDSEERPKKKVKLYNGWTIHRAEVLEKTHRLPGESAGARVNRAVAIAKEQWKDMVSRCSFSFRENIYSPSPST